MFKKDYIFVVNHYEFMSFTRFLINHGIAFRYGVSNTYYDKETKERRCEIEVIVHETKRSMNKIYKDLDMVYNYRFD